MGNDTNSSWQGGKDQLSTTEAFRYSNQRAVVLMHYASRRQLVVLGFLPCPERWAVGYWLDTPNQATTYPPDSREYIMMGPLGFDT